KQIMLLLVLAINCVSSQKCKVGWELFGESCYSFCQETVTWIDAVQYCQLDDAHLVHINDPKEYDFLVNSMKSRSITVAWTGGSERLHRGSWEWLPRGGLFGKYEKWFGTEPAGPDEDCLAIDQGHSYQWMDMSCTLSYKYICEMKVPVATENVTKG
ncbi:unnamed protein product, partial [Candidula unifasciata]